MKFALATSTLLLLSSCGHTFKQAESYSAKMARYKAVKYSDNKVPHFPTPAVLAQEKATRGPASVKGKKEEKSYSFSNKRLYFLTLQEQYAQLNNMLGSPSDDLNICPSFHSELHKQKQAQTAAMLGSKKIDLNKIDYAQFKDSSMVPEMYLPITRNSVTPVVSDVIGKEGTRVLNEALELHLNKTLSELKELCEFGNSDNYYTFENLYTLIQRGKLQTDKERLDALMKTTVFTNELLITSLKSRSINIKRAPASATSPFINEVYRRFQSPVKSTHLVKIFNK